MILCADAWLTPHTHDACIVRQCPAGQYNSHAIGEELVRSECSCIGSELTTLFVESQTLRLVVKWEAFVYCKLKSCEPASGVL